MSRNLSRDMVEERDMKQNKEEKACYKYKRNITGRDKRHLLKEKEKRRRLYDE